MYLLEKLKGKILGERQSSLAMHKKGRKKQRNGRRKENI
jgi:hypothetical protein